MAPTRRRTPTTTSDAETAGALPTSTSAEARGTVDAKSDDATHSVSRTEDPASDLKTIPNGDATNTTTAERGDNERGDSSERGESPKSERGGNDQRGDDGQRGGSSPRGGSGQRGGKSGRRGDMWRVCVGVAYCVLTTLSVAGYQAILPVLIDTGAYAWLCHKNDSASNATSNAFDFSLSDRKHVDSCNKQDLELDLMFTLTMSATSALSLLLGLVVQTRGPRMACQCGAVVMVAGCVLFGASGDGFRAYIPGYMLIGIGGLSIGLSFLSLTKLFPAHAGLILTLVNGAFDASSVVFILMQLLFNATERVTFRGLFWGYALIPTSLIIAAYWLLPDDRFGPEKRPAAIKSGEGSGVDDRVEEGIIASNVRVSIDGSDSVAINSIPYEKSGNNQLLDGEDNYFPSDEVDTPTGPEREIITCECEEVEGLVPSDVPLRAIIKTSQFWILVLWLAINATGRYFYITNVKAEIIWASDGNVDHGKTGAFIFSFMLPAGVLFFPVSSYLLDKQPIHVPILLMAVLSTVSGVLSSIRVYALQYLTMILVVINRLCLFAGASYLFRWVYGHRGLSTLYGLALTLNALINLSNYLWTYISKDLLHGDWRPMNLILSAAVSIIGAVLWVAVFKWDPSLKRPCNNKMRTGNAGNKCYCGAVWRWFGFNCTGESEGEEGEEERVIIQEKGLLEEEGGERRRSGSYGTV